MEHGVVVDFWPRRKFGFIAAMDHNLEYFFHLNDLAPESAIPQKGNLVEFEASKHKGKPKATNICILPSAKEILGGGGTR